MVVTIKDETGTGKEIAQMLVSFKKQKVTVEEIICQRVWQEVEAFNQRSNEILFRGLVTPSEAEQTLNGVKPKVGAKKWIDPEKQVYVALDAFKKNGFFVIVDDEQVEHLDQKIELKEHTNISFIKLTPLVGG